MAQFRGRQRESLNSTQKYICATNQDLTDSEKIPVLEKKLRSKTIHLVINVAIIVIFIFMFAGGLTTFPEWFYYILFGVFALNLFLVHLQKKQIRSLLELPETKN
jgi:hypothetical protein